MARVRGTCRICGYEGELDRHHIISKAMCYTLDRRDLIRNDGNKVNICGDCHNVTCATLRYRVENREEHLNKQAIEKMRRKGPRSKTPPPPPPMAKKKAKEKRHRCGICREVGHDRRTCQKRHRCGICREVGHDRRTCPRR